MFERLSLQPSLYVLLQHQYSEENWDDAKAACQSAGDRLAVFDSLESISWVKHMRKTHQGL